GYRKRRSRTQPSFHRGHGNRISECKLVFKTAFMRPIPNILTIHSLLEGYRSRSFSPVEVLTETFARIRRESPLEVWITLADRDAALARAGELGAALEQDAEAALA